MPPSKGRKLQPLLPTAVVDERTFASQRYPDQMRHAMADLVHQHLQPGTQERMWADEGRAHLINFTQFRGRDKQSPIALVDVAMCAMYPSSFGKRVESTRHEALRKWFVHIRSCPAVGLVWLVPAHCGPGIETRPTSSACECCAQSRGHVRRCRCAQRSLSSSLS